MFELFFLPLRQIYQSSPRRLTDERDMVTAKVQSPFIGDFEIGKRVNVLMLRGIIERRGAKGTLF